MTQFKKTLQDGTPGVAAHPVVTPGTTGTAAQPAGTRSTAPISPRPVPIVVAQPAAPRAPMPSQPVVAQAAQPPASQPVVAQAAQPPASQPVPSSDASALPPAPTKDELSRSRPPAGHRTPSATRQAPNFGSPMPENAPGWMLRARRMSLALEEAIQSGTVGPAMEACIERAWAAWELNGSTDKQIARVARLVEKAHTAIRETPAPALERAYNECAQVLWAGLPRSVKSQQDFGQVSLIVRELRAEADSWAAVVGATAKLLGWTQASRAHSAHAIRVAILSER
jgi:hypothetical protein